MPERRKDESSDDGPRLRSAEEMQRDMRRRLDSAKSSRDELKKISRVPLDDRPLLAGNLGKMFLAARRRDQLTMKDYFQMAFEKEWESHYKKNKRYIRLDGDAENDDSQGIHHGEYLAAGIGYFRLAKALSMPRTTGQVHTPEDQELLAVLRLVEGTSFDSLHARIGRRRQDQERKLIDTIQKVVSMVESKADLNGFLENATSINLGVPCDWPQEGSLSLIAGTGWGSALKVETTVVLEEHYRLGPSIPICEVGTPAALASFALVRVPKSRTEYLGLSSSVGYSIHEVFGLTGEKDISEGDYLKGGAWSLFDALSGQYEWEAVRELRLLNERQDNLGSILASLDPALETKLQVHFQVRFDTLYGQWKPAFSVQRVGEAPIAELHETEIRSGRPFGNLRGKVELPGNWAPFVDLPMYETSDSRLFVVAWPKWEGAMFELDDALRSDDPRDVRIIDENFYKSILGCHRGTFVLPGREAVDFLLEPLDPEIYSIDFLVNVPGKGFTEFQQGSLAEAIARNLAYAEPADVRIDDLLLSDARMRAAKLQAFVNECRAEYEKRLSRLD